MVELEPIISINSRLTRVLEAQKNSDPTRSVLASARSRTTEYKAQTRPESHSFSSPPPSLPPPPRPSKTNTHGLPDREAAPAPPPPRHRSGGVRPLRPEGSLCRRCHLQGNPAPAMWITLHPSNPPSRCSTECPGRSTPLSLLPMWTCGCGVTG
jgi:hypothetical protein